MRKPLHTFLLALPLCALVMQAQTPEPPAAPLPTAIASARKLFLGNAGDQENADCLRAYNGFYQGLGSLGRFQLVSQPDAADLVLELHYEIDLGQSIASNDSRRSVRQFRVVLLDPHTRVTLWSLPKVRITPLFRRTGTRTLTRQWQNSWKISALLRLHSHRTTSPAYATFLEAVEARSMPGKCKS